MASIEPIVPPGRFIRRILIEPRDGAARAELEDDYHRMIVTLFYDRRGIVTAVESKVKRSPWSICPGAVQELSSTLTGRHLSAVPDSLAKRRNCTHLFDLAIFAAAHAADAAPTAYEATVDYPREGRRRAALSCNGVEILLWSLIAHRVVLSDDCSGIGLGEMGPWIAAQPASLQEPARILRWVSMMAGGRQSDLSPGRTAKRFASGACFTFQPDKAGIGRRRPDAAVDFSAIDRKPLQDRWGQRIALE